MTAPLTPEALAEALAEFLANRLVGRRWQAHAHAKAMVAGPLAPLLAALQQVTAEKDEYAEALMQVAEVGGWQASAGLAAEVRSRITTATAEAARLRVEVEAKDRALKPFAEHATGFDWVRGIGREFPDSLEIARQRSGHTITLGDLRAARAATAREGA